MAFSDLRKLRESLQSVPLLIPTFMGDAVVEYRDEIVDLIHEQLEAGETPDETPIRPAYANPGYAFKKQLKNSKPAFGTPDLKNTGAYYASMRLDVFNDGFEPYATDKKAPALEIKYGKVVGFSGPNIARIRNEVIKPYLQRKVREILP